MDEQREQALHGGRQTVDIVRVGDTVRRPQHARSDFAHAVLRHLNAAGFNGAPRLLGIDEHGREVISYINGETIDSSPARLSDARLVSAARLVRRFHDATAGTALAAAQEIVAHGDLGPHNIVFSGDTAVAIVDWDHDVAPGSRLVDFGHAVWCCADVCEPDIPVAEQAHKVRLMCDAYGWDNPPAVIDEIAERFQRARNNHAAHQPQSRGRLRRDDRLDATSRARVEGRTVNRGRLSNWARSADCVGGKQRGNGLTRSPSCAPGSSACVTAILPCHCGCLN